MDNQITHFPTHRKSSRSPPVQAERLLREARIVYVKPQYLERLVCAATKILGRRGALTRRLDYVPSSRLNKILSGRIGMTFSRFIILCEISGIPLNEAIPNIYAIAPYGNASKVPLKKLKNTEASVKSYDMTNSASKARHQFHS